MRPSVAPPTQGKSLADVSAHDAAAAQGTFARNVMHFARVLRATGMPVGTDRIQLALNALQVAGLSSRADLHAVLFACLVDRPEHRTLFDQAFHLFWRDPDLMGRMLAMMLPRVESRASAAARNERLASVFFPPAAQRPTPQVDLPELVEIEASFTWSEREALRKADFETMTPAEWMEARRMLQRMQPFFEPLRTRRYRPSAAPGVTDWRGTMRMAGRRPDGWVPAWKERRTRPAPLVVLADISGSMSKYSRMLLHFAHALATAGAAGGGQAAPKVSAFVFGTRLTPITRYLRRRDPDVAVEAVVRAVNDWSGGTRIAAALAEFNRRWSRRVLGQNPTVLLVSDGLEHGDGAALSFEAERLAKSCRRLVWLNPLLRYDGFEPRASGIRALLPHVDDFVPCHNLASLEALAAALTSHAAR